MDEFAYEGVALVDRETDERELEYARASGKERGSRREGLGEVRFAHGVRTQLKARLRWLIGVQ